MNTDKSLRASLLVSISTSVNLTGYQDMDWSTEDSALNGCPYIPCWLASRIEKEKMDIPFRYSLLNHNTMHGGMVPKMFSTFVDCCERPRFLPNFLSCNQIWLLSSFVIRVRQNWHTTMSFIHVLSMSIFIIIKFVKESCGGIFFKHINFEMSNLSSLRNP